ncbi:MAG: TonB-dependent receptor, partial [Bacteroidia bacterium]
MYDSLNVPMAYVPVALLDAKDSLVYKGVITNDSGVYYFDKITPGKYLIKIIVPGYAIKYSSSFELDNASNLQIPDLKISSAGINLNEIAVTVIKRPIEFKNGNVTVFIEGSPLAVGNTAFDLLSRLPGVTVVDDNISIQGKQGVKIFIDDRMQQLSGQQIINVLKGINASMIEKIEIMKNPPVKYDASGSAGIINIKTKKIKIIGFSGSINATYTQAYYGNGLSGLELNYKGKKLTFFSSIGAADESVRKVNHTDRVVLFNSNTSELDQVYFERERNPYLYANIGSDWFVNSKNIIGVKISSWGAVAHHDRVGNIDIKNSDLGYNHSDYGYNKTNPWSYTNLNLNAEHLFDTVGTKLLFSADYTYNFDIYKGDFYTRFQDFTGPIISQDRIYQTANKLLLNIASAKLDFEKQLSKTLKLESGLKATHQNMLSDFYFANKDLTMDKYVTDSSLTNIFSYNELITAAYINLQKTVKKFNFQAGTRAENTNINAHSKTNDVKYTRQYFNLFPVVSVDYNANEKNSLQLSFNRRIERPDYNSFNPYRTFKNYLVTE